MRSGNTTVPSTREVAATSSPAVAERVPALVIAWSAREPQRIGEVALFDNGSSWTLGRASDDLTQVEFVRQRPRASVVTGALSGESLSRRQLEIERTATGLALRRVGQAVMRVNGAETDDAVVEDGDVVELVGHYLFLATTRPITLGDTFDWAAYPFGESDGFGIVGESAAAWALRADLLFAARASAHVLLLGESGTGKEIWRRRVPRARACPRWGSSFAWPKSSASTMPGGNVAAFRVMKTRRALPRRFTRSPTDGGTLFLDEIGEIPHEVQAHLLRMLDGRGEHQRLGETQTRYADLRLICATNRPLTSLKHDLVARLKVHVETPALVARREDIPLLVRHLILLAAKTNPAAARFVRQAGRPEVDLSPALIATLLRERFPTNVRELEQKLLRAMRFSVSGPLRLAERGRVQATAYTGPEEEIRAALGTSRGNVTQAADALGISRDALNRLIRKHGLRA